MNLIINISKQEYGNISKMYYLLNTYKCNLH